MALFGWHDNSKSGSFGVAGNWEGPNGPGVPGAGDDARVYGGPLTVTVSGQSVKNFGGAGGLIGVDSEITTLSGSFSVTGTLRSSSLVGGAFTVGTLDRCTVNATLTAQLITGASFLDGGAIKTVELADCAVRGANVTADSIGPNLGAGVGISAGSVDVQEIDLQGSSLIQVGVNGDGVLTAGTLTVGGGGEFGNPTGTGLVTIAGGGVATVTGAAAVNKGAIVVSTSNHGPQDDGTRLTLEDGLTVAGSGTMTVYGGGTCSVTGDIDIRDSSLTVEGGRLVATNTQVTIGVDESASFAVSGGGHAEIGSKLTHVRLGVGAEGEILVHETGSRLTIKGDLDVGAAAIGRVSITDLGRATVAGDVSVAAGNAFVGDAGSSLTVLGDVALGTATGKFGSLAANFGGAITVIGTMTVGDRGGGGFRLLGGSDATVGRLELAEGAKSGTAAAPCDVTLTGLGTTLTVLGDVDLNGRGYGTIIVSEGARLDVKGVIGSSTPSPTGGAGQAAKPQESGLGALQLNRGSATCEKLVYDGSDLEAELSNSAHLTVSGAMTLTRKAEIALTQNSKLDIGAASRIVDSNLSLDFSQLELKGSLSLSGDSTLKATNNSTIEIAKGKSPAGLVIGDAKADGTSVVRLEGKQSTLEVGTQKEGRLVVGAAGKGELSVLRGGEVTAADVLIGVAQGSSGKIALSRGSTLDVADNVTVGLQGKASLVLDRNAHADVRGDFEVGAKGVVTVGGADPSQRGGELVVKKFLSVNDGGRFNVGAGGEASDKGAFLREGHASVTGEGAHWNAGLLVVTSSTVTVGGDGSISAKELSVHADSARDTVFDLSGNGSIAIGGGAKKGALSVSEHREFEVRKGGDCDIHGALKVDGLVKIDGSLSVTDALKVDGLVKIDGSLSVTDALSGTGHIVVNSTGRLDLSSDARIAQLDLSGKLALGNNDVHITDSYFNPKWESGSEFDPHRGVIGAGKIIGDGAHLDVTGDRNGTLVFDHADGAKYTATFKLSAAKGGPDLTVAFDLSDIDSITGLPIDLVTIAAGHSKTFTLKYHAGVDIKKQSLTLVSNFDNVKDIELDFRLDRGSDGAEAEGQARGMDVAVPDPLSALHAHDLWT